MAQNQREMNRLKHIIEEKDREIEMLRDNETGSGGVDSGIAEDILRRIADLEGVVQKLATANARDAPRDPRINELEGMVKGLTEELLDLKAEVRKFGKVLEGKEELKPKPEVRRARPVPEKTGDRPGAASREAPAGRAPRPAPQPEVAPEPDMGMVTIMQPDGTLAEEPRKTNDDLIVAGNRPGRMYQSKTTREYRGKEERKPLIYADEDDTVEIKKK